MKTADTIALDLAPVGVKLITADDPGFTGISRFKGVSYCQAILQATFGLEVVVDPASIRICQWAPVVLGFKQAENEFEKTINRHLPPGTGSLLLAPIFKFSERSRPDIVIIRAGIETFRSIIEILGYDRFIPYQNFNLDETALQVLAEGPQKGFSLWAIKNVNRLLYRLNRFAWWQKLTTFLFRSTIITGIFDRFITKYMANMSMCRNSTIIPYQTGRANISFFCTGGIAWGKNLPDFMTSGFPYEIYRQIEDRLHFPGLPGDDQDRERSDRIRKKMIRNSNHGTGCS